MCSVGKSKMREEELIARLLNTDYGKEELRRGIIKGFKKLSIENTKKGTLAKCLLDIGTFGPESEEWESNSYQWSFKNQIDNTGS